jgi:solute carrier family 20 (sodium-dependent phosphate transporter)
MVLHEYTYIFAIGTFFALLEAYNNGANDVANAWATSVSSRSVSYRQAMILCLIFEMTGALAVGARTASTIKNGIIPISAFHDNAGVQLLAFTCASAGAAIWVMWCTRHNAHVSSTYSLVSSIAGVGVATVGVNGVEWGWNGGQGLGAIFAGLVMAPFISAGFAATIFMLVKVVVHMRSNPTPVAVYSSPFFFLIAGTICALSIVYKGSPRLGLNKKPAWYIATVSVGTGVGLGLLAAWFFVPFVYCRVIRRDQTLKLYDIWQGPLLFKRQVPTTDERAKVPNYAVIQHDGEHPMEDDSSDNNVTKVSDDGNEKGIKGDDIAPVPHRQARTLEEEEGAAVPRNYQEEYRLLLAKARAKHHAELREKRGPLGWAMRVVHRNRFGAGSIYEKHNMIALIKRLPAYPVIALLYGMHYDIHKAQVGVLGTPEGRRMERVYAHATKYQNEVEYLYSFVQIITACTASFAHGANDVGNAVGVWAAMYSAWSTSTATAAKAEVPLWQIAVTALTICIGFITYGYNIMKGMLVLQ